MAKIAIVGAGMMGSGIAWPIHDNGHDVRLVGTHLDREIIESIKQTGLHPKHKRTVPAGIKPCFLEELAAALDGIDVLVCGVSSAGIDWFMHTLQPYFKPNVPVLSITKGLVANTDGDLLIIPEYMESLLPENLRGKISINAVAGPCIAQELAARRQTCVNFCGKDEHILQNLKQLFENAYYHVFVTTDFIGAEVGVALKNAYAIAINIAAGELIKSGMDGIAHNYNPQAALFAQSMYEIRVLTEALGGKVDGVVGLTGSGDLYVTIFGGRNMRLGQLLGQDYTFPQALEMLKGVTLEGVNILNVISGALPRLAARGKLELSAFPLVLHLGEVIQQRKSVDIPWNKFFGHA